MSKKYKVLIKETLLKGVEVEAESLLGAIHQVEEKWRDSKIILTADNFTGAEITAKSEDGKEITGWRTLFMTNAILNGKEVEAWNQSYKQKKNA